MTESEALEAIEQTALQFGKSYTTADHNIEDIRQIVRSECLILLSKGGFSPEKGRLEGYLHTHCRRRLLNLRRKHWRPFEQGCHACHQVWKAGKGEACGKNTSDCRWFG